MRMWFQDRICPAGTEAQPGSNGASTRKHSLRVSSPVASGLIFLMREGPATADASLTAELVSLCSRFPPHGPVQQKPFGFFQPFFFFPLVSDSGKIFVKFSFNP